MPISIDPTTPSISRRGTNFLGWPATTKKPRKNQMVPLIGPKDLLLKVFWVRSKTKIIRNCNICSINKKTSIIFSRILFSSITPAILFKLDWKIAFRWLGINSIMAPGDSLLNNMKNLRNSSRKVGNFKLLNLIAAMLRIPSNSFFRIWRTSKIIPMLSLKLTILREKYIRQLFPEIRFENKTQLSDRNQKSPIFRSASTQI